MPVVVSVAVRLSPVFIRRCHGDGGDARVELVKVKVPRAELTLPAMLVR